MHLNSTDSFRGVQYIYLNVLLYKKNEFRCYLYIFYYMLSYVVNDRIKKKLKTSFVVDYI